MKPKIWIKSQSPRITKSVLKFPPLPQGEGRGEGERKRDSIHTFDTNYSNQPGLKARNKTAQGNPANAGAALGLPSKKIIALKGRNKPHRFA